MTTKEFKIQYALGTLSTDDRLKLADDTRTSKKILTILYKDENWFVRCRVTENPNTPIEVLEKLSIDKDRSVGASAFWQWLKREDK